MLTRLKYVSRFADELSSDDIDAIVATSARNNADRGISGVLLTAGGLFFQVIEGPPEEIHALWHAIERDGRHRDVLLLSLEDVDGPRLFPDWSMRRFDLADATDARLEPLRAILETIMSLRQNVAQLRGVLERAIWSELS